MEERKNSSTHHPKHRKQRHKRNETKSKNVYCISHHHSQTRRHGHWSNERSHTNLHICFKSNTAITIYRTLGEFSKGIWATRGKKPFHRTRHDTGRPHGGDTQHSPSLSLHKEVFGSNDFILYLSSCTFHINSYSYDDTNSHRMTHRGLKPRTLFKKHLHLRVGEKGRYSSLHTILWPHIMISNIYCPLCKCFGFLSTLTCPTSIWNVLTKERQPWILRVLHKPFLFWLKSIG